MMYKGEVAVCLRSAQNTQRKAATMQNFRMLKLVVRKPPVFKRLNAPPDAVSVAKWVAGHVTHGIQLRVNAAGGRSKTSDLRRWNTSLPVAIQF